MNVLMYHMCKRISLWLDEGLWLVGAIEFGVDLGVVLFLLALLAEAASVEDEVEGQQEAQHAHPQQAHVYLGTTKQRSASGLKHLCE